MENKNLFFIAALGCMLLFINFNTAAQNQTFPLPAPGEDSSTLPDPVQKPGSSTPSEAPARKPVQTPPPSPPAQSGEAAQGSGTAEGQAQRPEAPVQARRPATARRSEAAAQPEAEPAQRHEATAQPQPAAASPQTEIPDKGMFLGGYVGGGGYIYTNPEIPMPVYEYKLNGGGGFNGGLLWGYDFGLFASQVELVVSGDNGKFELVRQEVNGGGSAWRAEKFGFSGITLQIPVMVKLDLHWRRIIFQPQAGFYLNLSLGDLELKKEKNEAGGSGSPVSPFPDEFKVEYHKPLFGFMAGAALGVHIWKGYLFMDGRYAIDMGKSEVEYKGLKTTWNRSAYTVTLGYQYYFQGKQ
jgi:hypothetical protein